MEEKIMVDKKALLALLASVLGPPHLIRELVAVNDLGRTLGSFADGDVIDILVKDLEASDI